MAPLSDSPVRQTWLVIHIVLALAGYAALILTAAASVGYLIQERRLKTKKPARLLEKLPPLATLDNLISGSLGVAFVLITLAVVLVITWEFLYSGTALDRRSEGDGFAGHLGSAGGGDVSARHRGMAGPARGGDGAGGAGMLHYHLGSAGRVLSLPMKLLLTGLNHRTAPVEVRERLAFEEGALPEALDRLRQRPGLLEGMILSTCNRVEVAVTAEEETDAELGGGRIFGRDARGGPGVGLAAPVSL